MKTTIIAGLIMLLSLIAFVLWGGKEKPPQKEHWKMMVRNEMVPVEEYYRPILGYDSIQITVNYEGDRLRVNFCYPNKWERTSIASFKINNLYLEHTYQMLLDR